MPTVANAEPADKSLIVPHYVSLEMPMEISEKAAARRRPRRRYNPSFISTLTIGLTQFLRDEGADGVEVLEDTRDREGGRKASRKISEVTINKGQVKALDLRNRSLTNNILRDCASKYVRIRVALFSHNAIDSITALRTCRRLRKLDVSSNLIEVLPTKTFWEELPNLQALLLHDNRIVELGARRRKKTILSQP